MKEDKKAVWPWPDELDALIAAPEHHKLLLENDTIRVLDTLIRPKEITALHTHKWPASLYIMSWSDLLDTMKIIILLLIHGTLKNHLYPLLPFGLNN
jgi:hypothetical protein